MYDYRLGLLLLVGVYLISPIMLDWWLDTSNAWYRPFAFWFILLLCFIWLNNKQQHHDDL